MSIDVDGVAKGFINVLPKNTGAITNINYSTAGILLKNGKIHHSQSYNCYGWTYGYGGDNLAAVLTYLKDPSKCAFYRLPDDICLSWIKYITERSPYAGTTVNDAEHIFKTRVVIGDITKPMNVMYGALFSLRMLYERQAMVVLWDAFVKGGMTENEAFFMTSTMCPQDDKKADITTDFKVWVNVAQSSDHMPLFFPSMSSKEVKNMIEGKIVQKIDPMTESGNLRRVQVMFGDRGQYVDGSDKVMKKFRDNIIGIRKLIIDDKAKTKVNPFMVKSEDTVYPDRPLVRFSDIVKNVPFFTEQLRKMYA